jgi:hypothetical protein
MIDIVNPILKTQGKQPREGLRPADIATRGVHRPLDRHDRRHAMTQGIPTADANSRERTAYLL